MTTHLEPITYRLPAYWASYLINNDASGISAEEKAQADKFLADHKLPFPVDCKPDGFSRHNDAQTRLACDVEIFTFLLPR